MTPRSGNNAASEMTRRFPTMMRHTAFFLFTLLGASAAFAVDTETLQKRTAMAWEEMDRAEKAATDAEAAARAARARVKEAEKALAEAQRKSAEADRKAAAAGGAAASKRKAWDDASRALDEALKRHGAPPAR